MSGKRVLKLFGSLSLGLFMLLAAACDGPSSGESQAHREAMTDKFGAMLACSRKEGDEFTECERQKALMIELEMKYFEAGTPIEITDTAFLALCPTEGAKDEFFACVEALLEPGEEDEGVDSGAVARNEFVEGRLTVTDFTVTPRDCLRVPWGANFVNVTCNYELRLQATWRADGSPAHIHCQTWNELLPDERWSSYAVSEAEGTTEIQVVANPGGHIFRIGDDGTLETEGVPAAEDRGIPYECILTIRPASEYSFDGYQSLTRIEDPYRLASLQCNAPTTGGAASDAFCQQLPESNIKAALSAPWKPATKADIGAE